MFLISGKLKTQILRIFDFSLDITVTLILQIHTDIDCENCLNLKSTQIALIFNFFLRIRQWHRACGIFFN
jgi:hypothetical protein